jgi:hypothetical protein
MLDEPFRGRLNARVRLGNRRYSSLETTGAAVIEW